MQALPVLIPACGVFPLHHVFLPACLEPTPFYAYYLHGPSSAATTTAGDPFGTGFSLYITFYLILTPASGRLPTHFILIPY